MADLPPDVQATLSQLLDAAGDAARDRRVETVLDELDTVRRVTTNKVPDEDLTAELLYGCDRVEALVADEPLVAAEYLRAMGERVAPEE